ncbi:CotH kinase family protein [bacterium]|nr:CotH kinase family protein [bacterium]
MKYMSFFILIYFFMNMTLKAQDFDLPVYYLTIDSNLLEYLNEHPKTDEYFSATFVSGNDNYQCKVRFRGGTARTLPKKSWRIRFENDDNCFRQEVINLNAEYSDKSLMRNSLGMKLFDFFDLPAPKTENINLFVNNKYYGVFLQVEDINKDFLKRNNREGKSLYKAKNHGARMIPLIHYDAYATTWEKKIGDESDFSDIQILFSKIYYWNCDEFLNGIEEEVDVDNVLMYFAIEFSISSLDCFSKNLFLNFNEDRKLWELFPWDNDASFGNDWKGNYLASNERFHLRSHLTYHTLFQRLMEYDKWQKLFNYYVDQVIHQGFSMLHDRIDSTYQAIRNDIYGDVSKKYSNSQFDSEIVQLKTFLSSRHIFLENLNCFDKLPLTDYYCSNSFPSSEKPEVVFRVQSSAPQRVYLHYVSALDFTVPGDEFDVTVIELFDDGNHRDGDAGDMIYGTVLSDGYMNGSLTPFCFMASNYPCPANGLDYIHWVPTNTYALNARNNFTDIYRHISIGTVYTHIGECFVELINTSAGPIDLSYCTLNSGERYQKFMLPENTVIEAEDTLIVTSDISLAGILFEYHNSVGYIFFDFFSGDTIRLFSPGLNEMSNKVCGLLQYCTPVTQDVIISEINYHSCSNRESGDWFELYNPNSTDCDLSGWRVKDEKEDHLFVIPEGTVLYADSFLVVCQDNVLFHHIYPNVKNFIGSFDFGLSNGGECIRIFDPYHCLKDSVEFDDQAPWPEQADGNGATLQLFDLFADNALPENWFANKISGTPGMRNKIGDDPDDGPGDFEKTLFQNYPNPFNMQSTIYFRISDLSLDVKIKVYDISGSLVDVLHPEGDKSYVIWNRGNLCSGVYFYRLEFDGKRSEIKKAIVLK